MERVSVLVVVMLLAACTANVSSGGDDFAKAYVGTYSIGMIDGDGDVIDRHTGSGTVSVHYVEEFDLYLIEDAAQTGCLYGLRRTGENGPFGPAHEGVDVDPATCDGVVWPGDGRLFAWDYQGEGMTRSEDGALSFNATGVARFDDGTIARVTYSFWAAEE